MRLKEISIRKKQMKKERGAVFSIARTIGLDGWIAIVSACFLGWMITQIKDVGKVNIDAGACIVSVPFVVVVALFISFVISRARPLVKVDPKIEVWTKPTKQPHISWIYIGIFFSVIGLASLFSSLFTVEKAFRLGALFISLGIGAFLGAFAVSKLISKAE
jgi:hypothetical protein